MICPICKNPGAKTTWRPDGRWVECPNCGRHVYEKDWACPVCESRQYNVMNGTLGITLVCIHCSTHDHYVEVVG